MQVSWMGSQYLRFPRKASSSTTRLFHEAPLDGWKLASLFDRNDVSGQLPRSLPQGHGDIWPLSWHETAIILPLQGEAAAYPSRLAAIPEEKLNQQQSSAGTFTDGQASSLQSRFVDKFLTCRRGMTYSLNGAHIHFFNGTEPERGAHRVFSLTTVREEESGGHRLSVVSRRYQAEVAVG